MEELTNKLLGLIVLAGFVLGIIVPSYLIIRDDAGQATIPIRDIFKFTELITHKPTHLVKEETIETSNWTSINLELEIMSGTIMVETSPNVEDVVVKIYMSSIPVSIINYDITSEEPTNKICVRIDDSNTAIKLVIPTNKTRTLTGEINGGIARIDIDGKGIQEINLVVKGGLAWINIDGLGKSIIYMKVSGGAVYTDLNYKYFKGESRLSYECSSGLLNANIRLDSSTKIWIKSSMEGGYNRITFNNESIDYYKDKDYDSSISKILIEVNTTGGFTDIGIER